MSGSDGVLKKNAMFFWGRRRPFSHRRVKGRLSRSWHEMMNEGEKVKDMGLIGWDKRGMNFLGGADTNKRF